MQALSPLLPVRRRYSRPQPSESAAHVAEVRLSEGHTRSSTLLKSSTRRNTSLGFPRDVSWSATQQREQSTLKCNVQIQPIFKELDFYLNIKK